MAKQLDEMESLFKALADATRLRILGLLLTGEVCVCDIHESLKIPQPKASRHLAYLRRCRARGNSAGGTLDPLPDGHAGRPGARGDRRRGPHALTHVDTVHRDGERLKKRTGCCVPAPGDVAGVSCCAPQRRRAGEA